MLNRKQLKDYRILRGLSTREVAKYCEISQPMIVQIDNGTKRLTQHGHDEYVKGINDAYKAKQAATKNEAKKVSKRKKSDENDND